MPDTKKAKSPHDTYQITPDDAKAVAEYCLELQKAMLRSITAGTLKASALSFKGVPAHMKRRFFDAAAEKAGLKAKRLPKG